MVVVLVVIVNGTSSSRLDVHQSLVRLHRCTTYLLHVSVGLPWWCAMQSGWTDRDAVWDLDSGWAQETMY